MSFDWADYLKLAEALTQAPTVPGPEEAALRAAMSRAYYAAFCSARNPNTSPHRSWARRGSVACSNEPRLLRRFL
jgi:hypothetical protein